MAGSVQRSKVQRRPVAVTAGVWWSMLLLVAAVVIATAGPARGADGEAGGAVEDHMVEEQAAAAAPPRLIFLSSPGNHVLRTSLTWTTYAAWHGDNRNARDDDDNYFSLRNTGFGELSYGPHRLGLRLDTVHFLDPPDVREISGSGPAYGNNMAVERVHYRYSTPALQVQLGDYYKVLGRGLSLSIRRVDELGVDVSLRGGLMEWRGDHTRLTILGGLTNSTSLEPHENRLIKDKCTDSFSGAKCNPFRIYPADLVSAIEVGQRVGPLGELAVRYVHMRLADPERDWEDAFEPRALAGASWDLPDLAGVDLYLEGSRLYRYDAVPMERHDSGVEDSGFALYGQANTTIGPLSLLLEGKWYEDYHVATRKSADPTRYSTVGRLFFYQEPPNLEPVDFLVHNNTDTRAIRARFDWPVRPINSFMFASGLVGEAYPPSQPGSGSSGSEGGAGGGVGLSHTDLSHLYGGIEGTIDRISYRKVVGRRNEESSMREESINYGEGQIRFGVRRDQTVSLFGRHEHWTVTSAMGLDHSFAKGTWALGYSIAPRYSAAYIFSYDTELDSRRNYNTGQMEDVGNFFHGGEFTWRPSRTWSGKLFAGSMRGGRGCVSGSCRTFPPFTGVRAELVYRY